MPEKFHSHHVNEDSPEYHRHLESMQEFKQRWPARAYAAISLREMRNNRQHLSSYTSDYKDESRILITTHEYQQKEHEVRQNNKEILERVRLGLENKLETFQTVESLGLLFRETLNLESVKPVIEQFHKLDALCTIPDEYKLAIAFSKGDIPKTLAVAIAHEIGNTTRRENEQKLATALEAEVPAEQLIKAINSLDTAIANKILEFQDALPEVRKICQAEFKLPISDELLEEILQVHVDKYEKKPALLKNTSRNFEGISNQQ